LLDSIPEFDKLFVKKSQDEIHQILEGFIQTLDGGVPEVDLSSGGSSTETETDVNAVFNELMNS
jgi:hypothetical protein